MEEQVLSLKSQMAEATEKMSKLEIENATLRSEILKIRPPASSKEESMDTLEKNTLSQVVEEIRLDVKALKVGTDQEGTRPRSTTAISYPKQKKTLPEQKYDLVEKSLGEYPVIDIEHKTIEEERECMKSTFQEARRQLSDPVDGASLMGTTVEAISSSIILSDKVGSSIVVKISNHLSSTLTSPKVEVVCGKQISDQKDIIGHTCEAFSFEGDNDICGFVLSVRISCWLRLAIYCTTGRDRKVAFCIGFTPGVVPTDRFLEHLDQMETASDNWIPDLDEGSHSPLEGFVKHGKLLARVHMTVGPQSIVHADILELDNIFRTASRLSPRTKAIMDGKTFSAGSSSYLELTDRIDLVTTSDSPACIVEIVNCLNVSLKSSRRYIHNNWGHINLMPPEVVPFTREIFFASGNEIVEAIFAYEIDTTDLDLVIAFRVQASNNSFVAALVTLPYKVDDEMAFEYFMDPTQWKTHPYKAYAPAEDGEQTIQARNVHATVSMSETEKSHLQIRVFAT